MRVQHPEKAVGIPVMGKWTVSRVCITIEKIDGRLDTSDLYCIGVGIPWSLVCKFRCCSEGVAGARDTLLHRWADAEKKVPRLHVISRCVFTIRSSRGCSSFLLVLCGT